MVVDKRVFPVVWSMISTLNEVAVPSDSQLHEAPFAGHIGSVARFMVVGVLLKMNMPTTRPIRTTRLKIEMIIKFFFFFIVLLACRTTYFNIFYCIWFDAHCWCWCK